MISVLGPLTTIDVGVKHNSIGPETARLRISVQDTGIGIAPDKVEHIFEKFAQANSSTGRRYGGTGLGLSISQQLVQLMGGTIGVKSTLHLGSTFWFGIPIRLPKQVVVPELLLPSAMDANGRSEIVEGAPGRRQPN